MTDLDAYILDHHIAMRTCLEEIGTVNKLIAHVEFIHSTKPDRLWPEVIDRVRDIAVDTRERGWVDEARRLITVINWVHDDLNSPERSNDGKVLIDSIIDSLREYKSKQEERWFELDAELGRSLAHQYVDRHNINLVPLLEKVETEGGEV